jgi:F-type H+-transporting ATPase subunit b
MLLLEELFAEIVHEVAIDPFKFIVEAVQFVVLVLLVKAVAFGFGGKGGMLTNMLAERRERVAAELADADSASEELETARALAKDWARDARSAARRSVADAKRTADERTSSTLLTTDTEVAELRIQADETLAKERRETLGSVREQLVDLVTCATRQILDEGFSPAEQRTMIQRAIVESLDDLETVSFDLAR